MKMELNVLNHNVNLCKLLILTDSVMIVDLIPYPNHQPINIVPTRNVNRIRSFKLMVIVVNAQSFKELYLSSSVELQLVRREKYSKDQVFVKLVQIIL